MTWTTEWCQQNIPIVQTTDEITAQNNKERQAHKNDAKLTNYTARKISSAALASDAVTDAVTFDSEYWS